MTEANAPHAASASEAFDAALVRARAAQDGPLPVLPRLAPQKTPARTVTELRAMLSLRFSHAVPAAELASLHRQTVKELRQMERQLRWRRIWTALATFLRRYGLYIFGIPATVVLVGLAFIFRDAILAFILGLIPSSMFSSFGAPAGTMPTATSGAPAPAGSVP